MNRKIPPEAFDYYVSLGLNRSYSAVAERYGVSKGSVVNAAKREHWQTRLKEIEEKARVASVQKAVETMQAITERHLRAMRAIQVKGLEVLQSVNLETAMDGVRAVDLGVKGERLILGEPTERAAVNIEELIKREHEQWMRVVTDDEETDTA